MQRIKPWIPSIGLLMVVMLFAILAFTGVYADTHPGRAAPFISAFIIEKRPVVETVTNALSLNPLNPATFILVVRAEGRDAEYIPIDIDTARRLRKMGIVKRE